MPFKDLELLEDELHLSDQPELWVWINFVQDITAAIDRGSRTMGPFVYITGRKKDFDYTGKMCGMYYSALNMNPSQHFNGRCVAMNAVMAFAELDER